MRMSRGGQRRFTARAACCHIGNADEASAFVGGRGAGYGGGCFRAHRHNSSGLRTQGCKRIESARIKIPAFGVAVGLIEDDFLVLTTVRDGRRLECEKARRASGSPVVTRSAWRTDATDVTVDIC